MRIGRGLAGFGLLLAPGAVHHFVVLAVRAYGAWKCIRETEPLDREALAAIIYLEGAA